MKTHVAVLWHRNTPIEVHQFAMDVDGKSDYNARLSWEYFCDRENTKYLEQQPFEWRVNGMPLKDWEWHVKMLEKQGQQIESDKVFEHESIWDLYTAIGYDYKRKRYIRTE